MAKTKIRDENSAFWDEAQSLEDALLSKLLKDDEYKDLVKYYTKQQDSLSLGEPYEKTLQRQEVEKILERRLLKDDRYKSDFKKYKKALDEAGEKFLDNLPPPQAGVDYVGGSPGGSPIGLIMALGGKFLKAGKAAASAFKGSKAATTAGRSVHLSKASADAAKAATGAAAKEGGKQLGTIGKALLITGSVGAGMAVEKLAMRALGLSDEQIAFEQQAKQAAKTQEILDWQDAQDAALEPLHDAKIRMDTEFALRNEAFKTKMELADRYATRQQTAMNGLRQIAPNTPHPPSSFLRLAGAVQQDVQDVMPDRKAFTTPGF